MQWFLERIFQKEGIYQKVIRLSDKPLFKKNSSRIVRAIRASIGWEEVCSRKKMINYVSAWAGFDELWRLCSFATHRWRRRWSA